MSQNYLRRSPIRGVKVRLSGSAFAAAQLERKSFGIAPIEKNVFGGVSDFHERMQALDNRFVRRATDPGVKRFAELAILLIKREKLADDGGNGARGNGHNL